MFWDSARLAILGGTFNAGQAQGVEHVKSIRVWRRTGAARARRHAPATARPPPREPRGAHRARGPRGAAGGRALQLQVRRLLLGVHGARHARERQAAPAAPPHRLADVPAADGLQRGGDWVCLRFRKRVFL